MPPDPPASSLPPGAPATAGLPPGEHTSAGLPPAQRRLAMLTVIVGIGVSVIDSTMVTLALPGIVRELRIAESDAVWLVNAYQLAVLVLLLPLALLGDLIGYRRVYLAGAAVFVLASAACVAASGLLALTLARTLQGVGAAGMFAVNAALVRRIYPREQLGRGIAINSAVVAVASVAGPALAAAVLSVARWPWLFALDVPVAALVFWLGRRSLPRQPPAPPRRFPWADALLNAAMFLLLFLGVQRLAPHGATPASPPLAAAMIAAGIATGIVYVRRQRREAMPLLPVDLLAIPIFRLSICTSVAAFAAHTLASVALPFLLLEGLQRSPGEAGWLLAAWPLGTMLAAPLAGRLIGRWPSGLLGGLGLGLLAAGLAALAALPAAPGAADLAARLALCGIGFGLFQSPNNHTLVTSAPPHRAGGAAGMLGTARLTGQSCGALVIGLLYGLGAAAASRVPMLALASAAAFALAGSVSSLLRLREEAPDAAAAARPPPAP